MGILGVPPAVAKPPSCLRGDAELVAASGRVVVVRVPHRPADKTAPNDTDLKSCWTATGKRGLIAREYNGGSGGFSDTTEVTIFDEHYIGTIYAYGDGDFEAVEAYVSDARSGKRLHTTEHACEAEGGGVYDSAFLPKGGLAFACVDTSNVDRLYVFRSASARSAKVVDTSKSLRIGQLAVSRHRRLYWTVDVNGDGSTLTVKSLAL